MTPQPNPIRVLLVDDDEMSRELLCVLLQNEGYAVEAADSGEAALELLRRSMPAPDLVLTDIQMPGITGAELARRLRDVCGPATMLLAMSGSKPPARATSSFDGFLMKPFRMEQVAAAWIARSLKQSRGDVSSIAASAPRKASKGNMNAQIEAREAPTAISGHAASSLPVLDESIYQRLIGAMPAPQLQEMYALCLHDARQRIERMRELAENRDGERFVREAHAIKGGCGMLGATELHRMAAELEAHGLETSTPGRKRKVNSLDELSAACDRLERMLGSRVRR